MAGMQNRPWQTSDSYSSTNELNGGVFQTSHREASGQHPRGSLGQFIERSTSAPPPSSAAFFGSSSDNSDSLVGHDLLHHVTVGYVDSSFNSNPAARSLGHRKGKLFDRNNGDSEGEDGFGVVWMDGGDCIDNDGSDFTSRGNSSGAGVLSHGTAGSIGSSQSRPLSASGDVFGIIEGRRHLYGDLQLDFGSGLVRSQSAAPSSTSGRSSLGPPPGLSELNDDSYTSSSSSKHNSNNHWGQGIRRPSSTGVLGNGTNSHIGGGGATTFRPAAKTLMDLIQEDSSPEEHRPINDVFISDSKDQISDIRIRSTGSLGMEFSNSQSGVQLKGQQFQRLDSQPGNLYATSNPSHYQKHPTQLHQSSQKQNLHPYDDINDYHSGYQPSVTLQSHVGLQDSVEPQHQTQVAINKRSTGANANSHNNRQRGQYEEMQNPIYTHVHQHVQQLPQQHPQQQQQIYYNGQRIEIPHGMHTPNVQNHNMPTSHGIQPQSVQGLQVQGMPPTQTIQLPNGQTVYVSTSPPPQQPYGYTTVQYHVPHHQHAHLIQQSLHQGQSTESGQYVSVIPLQNGPQMAHWQANCVPSSQQAIMGLANTAGTTAPITISRVHGSGDVSATMQNPPIHTNHYATTPNIRSRDKGGRGKRLTTTPRRGGDSKTTSAPISSPLLEDFRASKSRDWTMRRIEGHVIEFCQDQNGSRFIQQRLEMGDVAEQQIVMQEVLPAIRRLRNDVFGNYVVQKLLDFGTPKMKADIQKTLEGEMVQLSLQMYGCRVVQKALEALNEDELPRLLREFHHNVLSCIHDQNGNHVIQKCIEVLNSRANKASQAGDVQRAKFLAEQIDFIIDDILVNTTSLSCHPYGCRVLQRILEHCADPKKKAILDQIKKCHEKLLDDQYGNYVIQHVLQFGRDEDRDSILHIVVKSGLLGLSRQKFASNVVEKLLKYGNSQQRCAIVREMLKRANDPSMPSEASDGSASVVLLMVRDAYANYVVQTTLDVVPESEEKKKLLEELNLHTEELRNYTFAKHIVAKLSSLNGEG